MKSKYRGQITLEAAIVMPVVMMLIISLIFWTMYIHDVLVIRAYVYGAGNEFSAMEYDEFQNALKNKIKNAPLFEITPAIRVEEHLNSYEIHINGTSHLERLWIYRFMNAQYSPESIQIEKEMSRDMIYVSQVILSQLEKMQK